MKTRLRGGGQTRRRRAAREGSTRGAPWRSRRLDRVPSPWWTDFGRFPLGAAATARARALRGGEPKQASAGGPLVSRESNLQRADLLDRSMRRIPTFSAAGRHKHPATWDCRKSPSGMGRSRIPWLSRTHVPWAPSSSASYSAPQGASPPAAAPISLLRLPLKFSRGKNVTAAPHADPGIARTRPPPTPGKSSITTRCSV